jgi:hypothetical protein
MISEKKKEEYFFGRGWTGGQISWGCGWRGIGPVSLRTGIESKVQRHHD